jgi:hypothetical protein
MLTLLFVHEPIYLISCKKDNYDNLNIKAFNTSFNQINSSNYQSSPEPEQDPKDDTEDFPDEDFVKKRMDNNNVFSVKPKNKVSRLHELVLANLKSTPVSLLYNLSKDRIILLKGFKKKSGIYLIHNNVNGKQYVGSGMDLGKRLSTYYFPSRLSDRRYISNSLLKYGHGRFSLVILQVWDNPGSCKKIDLISKEQ